MQPPDRGTAFWLFLTFLLLYLLTSGGHFYSSDDVQKLAVLDAYFKHGRFAIAGGWVPGIGGLRYAWFPLGASLVMLPGWLVGHAITHSLPSLPADYVVHFVVSQQNSVISAALVASLYLVARALGARRGGAAFAAIALGLGTMVWPYAKTAWSEPTATLVTFWGLFALARGAAAGRRAGAWLLGAGSLLALAAFIRQELAIAALAAALWLAFRTRQTPGLAPRAIAGFLAPLAVVFGVSLWYNGVRFGAPLAFPNYRLPQSSLVMEEGRFGWSLKNIFQYTLSPNQGLVWYSPPVLLGLAGLRRFARSQRSLVSLGLATLAPMALFYVYGWGLSSWAWALRYSYLFVPFLLLPAAGYWDAASRRARRLAVGVVALGAGVQALGVCYDFIELYSRTMAEHAGLSIQGLMTQPRFSPLWLAIQHLPELLANAAHLIAHPVPPLRDTLHYHTLRGHLPDLWPLLQLLGPVPRPLIAMATAALFALWLYALVRLRASLRAQPRDRATPRADCDPRPLPSAHG